MAAEECGEGRGEKGGENLSRVGGCTSERLDDEVREGTGRTRLFGGTRPINGWPFTHQAYSINRPGPQPP